MFRKFRTAASLIQELRHISAIRDAATSTSETVGTLAAEIRADRSGVIEALRAIEVKIAPPPSVAPIAPYWPEIEAVARLHLRPTDIVFDIGANQGTYTELFAGIAKQVVAFEPNPALAARVRARSLAKAEVHEIALSDAIGEATFYIDDRPSMDAVASSLLELIDLKASGMARPIKVRTTTLDAFVQSSNIIPTFIKIDVEGHEPAVLAGGRETINSYRPVVLFEMWENHWERFRDTFAWLSNTHYLVRAADGADAVAFYSNNKATGGVDILALPLR